MNKKLIGIFIILSLIILNSCTKESNNENKEKSSDSNTVTLGEIYNLSEEDEFSSIYIIQDVRLEGVMESDNKSKSKELTSEEFKDVFNYIINLKCQKEKASEMITLDNLPEYSIGFSIKEDEEIRGFDYGVGKSYLLISPLGTDSDYMYKHELTENDYKKIISMLDVICNE